MIILLSVSFQMLDTAIAEKPFFAGLNFGRFFVSFRAFGEVLAGNLTRCHIETSQIIISRDFSVAFGEIYSQNLTKCPKNDAKNDLK